MKYLQDLVVFPNKRDSHWKSWGRALRHRVSRCRLLEGPARPMGLAGSRGGEGMACGWRGGQGPGGPVGSGRVWVVF